MNDELRSKWRALLHAWAVDPTIADQEFADACRHYVGPGRFYHTLGHIQCVVDTVESLATRAENLNAVMLAAWLHDVIYDSKSTDNEEKSAAFAKQLCDRLTIPVGHRVAGLILQTKTHDAREEDSEAHVLIDADLAILGANESEYRDYAENIRREYAWVPEADYRHARQRVLKSFLARPRIYQFLQHLEQPARNNLTAEVAQLARF